MTWELAEATDRLGELFSLTHSDGPQRISRREETVIVITEAEYQRLRGSKPSFKEMLLACPSLEGLDLSRDPSPMRDISL